MSNDHAIATNQANSPHMLDWSLDRPSDGEDDCLKLLERRKQLNLDFDKLNSGTV